MNKAKLLIGSAALVCTQPLFADTSAGKELHDESCITCHKVKDHTALYTSDKRKVDSLHRLGGMVSGCTQVMNVDWFPDEEVEVVKYLNEAFYHFPPK